MNPIPYGLPEADRKIRAFTRREQYYAIARNTQPGTTFLTECRYQALGLAVAAREVGRSLDNDFSIITFGPPEQEELDTFQIQYLHCDASAIGKQAAGAILDQLNDTQLSHVQENRVPFTFEQSDITIQ